jgi:hypothetical protein
VAHGSITREMFRFHHSPRMSVKKERFQKLYHLFSLAFHHPFRDTVSLLVLAG